MMPYLTTQLSSAFDVYLEILQCVDQHLCTALKCDTLNWHLLNSCPACFYKLDNEPKLEFEWLARSDFWVDLESVDKFSGEVRSRVAEEGNNIEDTAVETNPAPFSCADWWKNTGPETWKKMFSVFDQLGIFIVACRHRFVLLACDVIQSRELAKYPLAIIDKLLTVYGKNGACAYNIGCAFTKTLGNSTIGPRAQDLGFCLMVGAFHGHAHNCMCQLDWHPMYIMGTGHSKGEGCEHIFSTSNALARGTRHASTFHWHQTIEQHFAFWNDDKYANLSNFLWNHYCKALKSIEILTVELSTNQSELSITDDDFPRYLKQDCAYLHSLKQPPVRDQFCIRYAEALDELTEQRTDWHATREAANSSLTGIAASSLQKINEVLAQARIHVDSSYVKLQHAEVLVIGGPEYTQFKTEACLGKYCAAIDELERLVIMQLFKLSKLLLSGTGYKLRQQISKALQWHSEAIRNVINQYNIQAVTLNSLCLKILWKDIVDYSFLGKFDLLRHSCADIHSNDWAKPAHQEATNKFFKLRHAHEEVERLNIEVHHLCTAIHAEELQTSAIIDDLLLSDLRLAAELQCQWRLHAAVNAVHCYCLDRIESLAGFLGIRGIGTGGINAHVQHPSLAPNTPSASHASRSLDVHAGSAALQNVDDIHAIITTDYADIDAIECEEHSTAAEDMANFFYSITD
ncbi:hypothetical protein DFH29DRAFT_878298 [Suillus ampliporus]|nr:hypothetical protein DFH29DRAFT_878298 [Suillus ampliporus]